MKKIMKPKRIIACILLLITIFSIIDIRVFATDVNEASLVNHGLCDYNIQYWKSSTSSWSYIETYYVTYNVDGAEYPAYCLDAYADGVGAHYDAYTVDIDKLVTDVYDPSSENYLTYLQVWRTIINGYPYKTPSEMGVANEQDAFVATKQAVYCILYGYDPSARYNGTDDRGVAIKNAIINMVNAGRNGAETPNNGTITLSKSGNLYEDGDYYTQKIDVSCSANIGSYNITGTSNMPDGAIITNVNGEQTTSFLGSESMYLKVPKTSMCLDISNATINIQGKCQTYPIFYGQTRISGTQDYAITYSSYSNQTASISLSEQTNTAHLKILKVDDETDEPLEGVKFTLEREDGAYKYEGITDENGELEFTNLYQGTYILTETSTGKNYILTELENEIILTYGNTTEVTIGNTIKKGKVKVIKVDSETEEPLEGVKFNVIDIQTDEIIDVLETDKNGEAVSQDLRVDRDYYLEEIETLENYILETETFKFNVIADETTEINITNDIKRGKVKVIKVDSETEEPLEGVKFNVIDSETEEIIETLETDENGEAVSSDLRVDRDYYLEEIETLENYILNEETFEFNVTADEIVEIKITNEKEEEEEVVEEIKILPKTGR